MSRRLKLEEMLSADPNDPFLCYALALEEVKAGDRTGGCRRLADMTARFPDHVPAYFQLGQVLAEDGDSPGARSVLTAGLQAAKRTGNDHAAAEMQELLSTL